MDLLMRFGAGMCSKLTATPCLTWTPQITFICSLSERRTHAVPLG